MALSFLWLYPQLLIRPVTTFAKVAASPAWLGALLVFLLMQGITVLGGARARYFESTNWYLLGSIWFVTLMGTLGGVVHLAFSRQGSAFLAYFTSLLMISSWATLAPWLPLAPFSWLSLFWVFAMQALALSAAYSIGNVRAFLIAFGGLAIFACALVAFASWLTEALR